MSNVFRFAPESGQNPSRYLSREVRIGGPARPLSRRIGKRIPHVEAVLNEQIPQAPFHLIWVQFCGGVLAIGSAHFVGKVFRREWPDCRVLPTRFPSRDYIADHLESAYRSMSHIASSRERLIAVLCDSQHIGTLTNLGAGRIIDGCVTSTFTGRTRQSVRSALRTAILNRDPGLGREHQGLLILARHGRAYPGHPRLTSFAQEKKTWMPGTRPGMTGYVSGGTRPSVLASRPR